MELLQSLRHLHGSGEAAYHQQLTSTSLTSSSSSRSNNTARTADAVQAGAAGMIDSAPLRVGPSRGRGRATAAPHAVFILDDDGPQSSKEGTEMASRSTNYTFLTASCSSELSTGSGVEERADKCGAGTTTRCSVQRGHRGAASVVAPPLRMAPRSPWPSRVPTPILTAPTRRRTTSSTASMRAYSAHAEEDDGTADIQELARADEQMKSRNNIKLGRDESARRHPGKGHNASGETNDTNNLPQFARGFSGLTRSSALVSESPLLSRAGTSFLSPPSLTEPATSTASSPRHHATRGASGRATSRPGDWTTPAIELLAHEAQEGAWRETFDAECSVERQTELVQLRRQVKEMEVELKFAHQTELQNGNRSEAIAPAEDVGKEDGQDDAYIHLLEEVVQHYRDEVVALRHETSDLRDALERRRSQLSECRQLYGSTVRCLLQDRHDLEQQRAVVVNELEEMASMLTTARAAERAALRRGMEIGPAMCDATSKGSFTPISTTLSYTFNGRDGAVVQGAIPSLQSSLAEPSTPAPLTHLETARPAFSTHGRAHCRSVSGGSSSGAWSPPKLPTPSSSLSVPNVCVGVRGGGGLSSPWASHARARAAGSGVIEVGHAIDEHADPQSSGPMLLNPDPPSHESLEEAQLRMRVEQLKQRNQELVDLLKNALKSLSELASYDMSDDDDDELSPRTRAW